MPIQILMPALSPTMEEGTLAKWLVKEGDTVKSGMIIAEIETDKATMEVEAVDEGVVGRILIPAGTDNVRVNAPIAILLLDGESAGAPTGPSLGQSSPETQVALGGAQTFVPLAAPASRPVAATVSAVPPPSAHPVNGPTAGRIKASPLAKRIAEERGLDLATLGGSGPYGRIVKRDVENAVPKGATEITAGPGQDVATHSGSPLIAEFPAPIPDDKVLALYQQGSYEIVPHDGMRRIIAERLTRSKQTIPHFYLTVDCRLDELLRARERMNATSPKSGARVFELSVNDFIVKAMALALQQVPAANATWMDGGMLRHKSSDVGVAVAVEGGHFTPVIRHAELKSLSEISNEMRDLAERARKRRLAPHEYQGGTTSISNLGMFGIKSFDAVINPPHATILAVGAGEKRPVVTGDRIEISTVMSCTLSCDHRVVDGAIGADLLGAFRSFMEDPVRMLV